MQGFISLHRKSVENPLYFEEKFSKWQAWCDLLLLANYKSRTEHIKGVEIQLKPGELCRSKSSLAERWKWSECKVRKFLDDMLSSGMIATQNVRVTTIISILNWSKYQQLSVENTGESIGPKAPKSNTDNKEINNKTINNNKSISNNTLHNNTSLNNITLNNIYNNKSDKLITSKKDISQPNGTLSIERYLREFKLVNGKP